MTSVLEWASDNPAAAIIIAILLVLSIAAIYARFVGDPDDERNK